MDRLSFVICIVSIPMALALVACNSDRKPVAPPPSRVVAVAAKGAPDETAETFCDGTNLAGAFSLPATTGAVPENGEASLWVNLWATWCKPCIAEMPFVEKWAARLRASGRKVALVFVSVDEEPEAFERFYASRPTFPKSVRLADPTTLPGLLERLGLGKNTGLPIHIFVSPEGKVRCVRAAAVSENHFDVISSLFD